MAILKAYPDKYQKRAETFHYIQRFPSCRLKSQANDCKIDDLNMQAVERKSQSTKRGAVKW